MIAPLGFWRFAVQINVGPNEHYYGYILFWRKGIQAGRGPIEAPNWREFLAAMDLSFKGMSLINKIRARLYVHGIRRGFIS